MLYLKAIHLIAVLTWLGGMLGVALMLASAQPGNGPLLLPERKFLLAMQRWDRRVTTPAMLLAWLLGAYLAQQGHWFGSKWLSVKLLAVFALSALHGLQSGGLRRLCQDNLRKPGASLRHAPAALLAMAGVAITAVIVKPF